MVAATAVCTNRVFTTQDLFHNILLANLSDAVISTDKYFKVLTWNKAAEKIYGIPANLAIGKYSKDLVEYQYINTNRDLAYMELINNHCWKGNVKFKRNDGMEVLLEASVTEVISDTNELLGYVTVNRDITDYSKLRICIESLKAGCSFLTEGVFLIDRDLKLNYLNEKAFKIFRASYNITLKTDEDFLSQLPKHRKDAIAQYILQAFAGYSAIYDMDIEKGENKFISLQKKYCPIKNEYGEINHVAIIVKNVTKQKLENLGLEKLKEDKNLFETFMSNTPYPSWVEDLEGRIVFKNKAYEKAFNLHPGLKDSFIKDLFPKEAAALYLQKNRMVLVKNRTVHTTEEVNLPSGEIRKLRVTRFPLTTYDRKLIGGWAIEI